jgi:hypothetical protein
MVSTPVDTDGAWAANDADDSLGGVPVYDPNDVPTKKRTPRGASGGEADEVKTRKPRSPNKPKEGKVSQVDIGGIEALLFSVHTMLASSTQVPELLLAPEEAHQIATALANVQRHYAIEASAKAVDWANLMMVVGAVYGTRFVSYRLRTARKSQ